MKTTIYIRPLEIATIPDSVTLYEFQPRPGEEGQPDPRDSVKEKLKSAPDILKLSEDAPRVKFNREWQMYLKAINPNMSDRHVAQIMQTGRWGFNKTGIPGHANYIQGEELDKPDPFTDKDRTFAYNIHAAVEDGNEIILTMFDGTKPPPPLSEINPQTHPWMYLVLTVVYRDGHVGPFPNGGLIEQIINYLIKSIKTLWYSYVMRKPPEFMQALAVKEATLFPLVASHGIRYPLDKVRRVDAWKMPY